MKEWYHSRHRRYLYLCIVVIFRRGDGITVRIIVTIVGSSSLQSSDEGIVSQSTSSTFVFVMLLSLSSQSSDEGMVSQSASSTFVFMMLLGSSSSQSSDEGMVSQSASSTFVFMMLLSLSSQSSDEGWYHNRHHQHLSL